MFSYYTDLRDLLDAMNQLVGRSVLFYIAAATPYFAENFVNLDSQEWYYSAVAAYFCFTYSIALLLAAEAQYNVGQNLVLYLFLQ